MNYSIIYYKYQVYSIINVLFQYAIEQSPFPQVGHKKPEKHAILRFNKNKQDYVQISAGLFFVWIRCLTSFMHDLQGVNGIRRSWGHLEYRMEFH